MYKYHVVYLTVMFRNQYNKVVKETDIKYNISNAKEEKINENKSEEMKGLFV